MATCNQPTRTGKVLPSLRCKAKPAVFGQFESGPLWIIAGTAAWKKSENGTTSSAVRDFKHVKCICFVPLGENHQIFSTTLDGLRPPQVKAYIG